MKKLMAATLAVCMLALLVVAVPRASADSDPDEAGMVLVSYTDMTFSLEVGHWTGTVSGDVRGALAIYEQPQNFVVGDKEYFFEAFTITTSRGEIQGTDVGVYNLTTGAFWAHGAVTAGTGHWMFLVGYTLFEWGITSTPGVFPMTGHHAPFILLPAHPTFADDARLLVSYTNMAYSPDWGYWRGTVAGDVTGTVGFWEQPQNYVEGNIEFFFEAMTVTTNKGVLQGFDVGYYDLANGNFWAYGQITSASQGWHSLAGLTFFEWGTTSTPMVFPMIGEDVPFVLLDL